MQVTFVTDTYAPQINGVANTLQWLVLGLREMGDIVDVIRPSVLACDEKGLRVPSIPVPGYPEVRVGLPFRLTLQTRWYRNRPDIIYVATESPLGISAINAARSLHIPVVSGFHTNFQRYMAHYQMPLLENATMNYLRLVHNRTQTTFAPSQELISELYEHGFDDLKLLPRGVDTKLFSPKKRSQALRNDWGADLDSTVGLYVGRVAAEKNIPLAIEVFNEIQKVDPDFKAIVVGDGPKLEDLQQSYPSINFVGKKTGEDLATHYASADLFVFASVTETFGNVTLEAMASGLAVLAYNYAAARHHIKDGINGFTAEFDNNEAFKAKALEIIKADKQQIESVREQARQSARKVRWKKVVKRFRKDLEETICSKPHNAQLKAS